MVAAIPGTMRGCGLCQVSIEWFGFTIRFCAEKTAWFLRARMMELDELVELVAELEHLVDEADVAADAGNVVETRERLREAKELLDSSFLA